MEVACIAASNIVKWLPEKDFPLGLDPMKGITLETSIQERSMKSFKSVILVRLGGSPPCFSCWPIILH